MPERGPSLGLGAEQRAAPRLGLPGALVSGDLRQEGDVAKKSPRRRFPLILRDSDTNAVPSPTPASLTGRGSWRATSGAPFPLCPAARLVRSGRELASGQMPGMFSWASPARGTGCVLSPCPSPSLKL